MYNCKLCFYSTDRSSNLQKHNGTQKHVIRTQFELQNTTNNNDVNICQFIESIKPLKEKVKVVTIEKKPKKKLEKKVARKKIPISLKLLVWDYWIGDEIGKTKCLCCGMIDILQGSFDCGHIIAEVNGGKSNIHNLKPICGTCNSSMGTKNMDEFMKEWYLEIAEPKNKVDDVKVELIDNVYINDANDEVELILTKYLSKQNNSLLEIITDDGTKRYICEQCNKSYSSKKHLWRHKNDTICGTLIKKQKQEFENADVLKLKKQIEEMSKKLTMAQKIIQNMS